MAQNPIGEAETRLGGDAPDFSALAAAAANAEAEATERERKLREAAQAVRVAATRDYEAIARFVDSPTAPMVPVLEAYVERYGSAEVRVDDVVQAVEVPEVARVRATLDRRVDPPAYGLSPVEGGFCPWDRIDDVATTMISVTINGSEHPIVGSDARARFQRDLENCGYQDASAAFSRWRTARTTTNIAAASIIGVYGVYFPARAAGQWRLEFESALANMR